MKDSPAAHATDGDAFPSWEEIAKFETVHSTLWVYAHLGRLEIVNMSSDGKSITTSLDNNDARKLFEALQREFK